MSLKNISNLLGSVRVWHSSGKRNLCHFSQAIKHNYRSMLHLHFCSSSLCSYGISLWSNLKNFTYKECMHNSCLFCKMCCHYRKFTIYCYSINWGSLFADVNYKTNNFRFYKNGISVLQYFKNSCTTGINYQWYEQLLCNCNFWLN